MNEVDQLFENELEVALSQIQPMESKLSVGQIMYRAGLAVGNRNAVAVNKQTTSRWKIATLGCLILNVALSIGLASTWSYSWNQPSRLVGTEHRPNDSNVTDLSDADANLATAEPIEFGSGQSDERAESKQTGAKNLPSSLASQSVLNWLRQSRHHSTASVIDSSPGNVNRRSVRMASWPGSEPGLSPVLQESRSRRSGRGMSILYGVSVGQNP